MDVLLAPAQGLAGRRSASGTPRGLVRRRHPSGQSYRADVCVVLSVSTSESLAVLSSTGTAHARGGGASLWLPMVVRLTFNECLADDEADRFRNFISESH